MSDFTDTDRSARDRRQARSIAAAGRITITDQIQVRLRAIIKELTPPGTRLMMEGSPVEYAVNDVRVCCDGEVAITAY